VKKTKEMTGGPKRHSQAASKGLVAFRPKRRDKNGKYVEEVSEDPWS
jgi:hypothetical protein